MLLSPLWLSGLLWIAFTVYWSAAARNSAPVASSESPASRQLHSLLLNGAIVLGFVRFAPLDRRWLPERAWLAPLGLALQLACALLAVWARRHLGRNWSGAVQTKVDHQLVRSGPYRVLRHPIYTGMLGMIAGTALVSGEWHGLLGVALMAVAYARKIPMEEQRMREAFGAEWEEWRRRSWVVIPGLV
jgi:protein-S-isoprenylcysteine O-methyltransferase Ste14